MLDNGRPVAGTEGMSIQQIEDDILRGGRFRVFLWNFSIIVMSFQRSTGLRYYRAGEGCGASAWPWTVLSMLIGWWGIPWGVIYTIGTLYTNCMGGKDITADILSAIVGPQRMNSIMTRAVKPQADIALWLLRILVLSIPASIAVAIFAASSSRN